MAEIKQRFYVKAFWAFCFFYAFSSYSENQTLLDYTNNGKATNEIPYFDNRFRIDAQLEEIILIFYRKAGAAPIILVRPDGSKININNYPPKQIEWFDDLTFDMIKIKKPMPGPWQAVGNILPNSKIMVVSDIRLEAEPLPEVILAGETLKIEAKLYNSSSAIEQSAFRSVVSLDVDFYSANKAEDENFNADSVELTTFQDDGRGLDEYAADGRFTGEFQLTLAAGSWNPVYSIKMPMVERELPQKTIIVRPSPVELSVDISDNKLGHHVIKFDINPEFVKPESMVFQGKIILPSKQSEPFSIMPEDIEGDVTKRKVKIGYSEAGLHKVMVNAFGETINGREFRMVLHQFNFNVEFEEVSEAPVINLEMNESGDDVSIDDVQKQIEEQSKKAQAALEAMKAEQIAKNEAQQQIQLWVIVLSNIVLITVAGIAFVLYRRKQKK